MINKIKREDYPEKFDEFIDDIWENSYYEHRRGQTFFAKSIYWIAEKNFPEFPELWGYWESNQYITSEIDTDWNEIYELNRVEKKTKIIEIEEWVQIEE